MNNSMNILSSTTAAPALTQLSRAIPTNKDQTERSKFKKPKMMQQKPPIESSTIDATMSALKIQTQNLPSKHVNSAQALEAADAISSKSSSANIINISSLEIGSRPIINDDPVGSGFDLNSIDMQLLKNTEFAQKSIESSIQDLNIGQ